MKGSLLWKLMYLFCAAAGILAGYGIFALTDAKEHTEYTKDSTLVRDAGDSVFFMGEEEMVTSVPTPSPALATPTILPPEAEAEETTAKVAELTATSVATPAVTPTVTPVMEPTATPTVTPVMEPTATPVPAAKSPEASADKLPSLGLQWAAAGEEVPQLTVSQEVPEEQEPGTTEVFTYPAKIFGQTPVINRSDAYVSYFEFCYDLIAMVEKEVAARGLNLNTLMTKFAVKALLCGVDIEKLDINAPIPRRLAALCLWLAAQVLNESGCDTSAKSAEGYVTDIGGCSNAEKKAVAYLYESGILKGYGTPGQKFYPAEGLKTEAGNTWLGRVKQCWK